MHEIHNLGNQTMIGKLYFPLNHLYNLLNDSCMILCIMNLQYLQIFIGIAILWKGFL